MRVDSEDEALDWGDDDPSHVAGPTATPLRSKGLPAETTATNSAALVGFGILGGIFLLYCVGWFLAVRRDDFVQPSLFGEVMYQLGQFLAVASPLIWVGAVFALVRRPAARLVWLGLGVLLLVPWPFVMGA